MLATDLHTINPYLTPDNPTFSVEAESYLITVNPAVAADMLKAYPYERQRKVKADTLNNYVAQMQKGSWLGASNIEIAYGPGPNGSYYGRLINGQHRLTAVIKAGITTTFMLQKTYCRTEEEVNLRYIAMDAHTRRSASDAIRALDLTNDLGLGTHDLNKLQPAAAFIEAGFRRQRGYGYTQAEKTEFMRQYAPAANFFIDAIQGAPRRVAKLIRTVPFMAVGLITFDQSSLVFGHDRVHDFWSGIAKDDGLTKDDPRKAILRYMIDNEGNRKHDQSERGARYAANCFNAWATGRKLAYTRVPFPQAPITILGSRFNGKEEKV